VAAEPLTPVVRAPAERQVQGAARERALNNPDATRLENDLRNRPTTGAAARIREAIPPSVTLGQPTEADGRVSWTPSASIGREADAGQPRTGRTGRVTAGVGIQAGVRLEVSTPTEQAGALARGFNPRAPQDWPVGTRMTLAENHSVSVAAGARRGPVQADAQYLRGQENAVTVERTDPHHVRITTSQDDTDRQRLNVGAYRANTGGGMTEEMHGSDVRRTQVDVDTRTPEGRAALEAFMRNGTLPTHQPPAVTREETVGRTRGAGVSVNGQVVGQAVGDLRLQGHDVNGQTTRVGDGTVRHDASVRLDSVGGSATDQSVTTTAPDGTAGRVITSSDTLGGATARQVRTLDATGEEDRNARRYQLDFPEGEAAAQMRAALDLPPGNAGVRAELTHEQVAQFQNRLRELTAAGAPVPDYLRSMAEARTPEDFARMLGRGVQGGTSLPSALNVLRALGESIPMTGTDLPRE
jgi:hypothetical protein